MKHLFLLILIALTSATTFANESADTQSDRYITEDLHVYVRKGPNVSHSIAGRVKTGDKVTFLEKGSDGKFTKIRDKNNREFWIESNLLSDKPSEKTQIPALTQEIELLKKVNEEQAQKLSAEVKAKNELISKLNSAEGTVTELNAQIARLNALPTATNVEMISDEKLQEIKFSWFTRGGIIAGIGVIIGLVLPAILPRRKRDSWIN